VAAEALTLPVFAIWARRAMISPCMSMMACDAVVSQSAGTKA